MITEEQIEAIEALRAELEAERTAAELYSARIAAGEDAATVIRQAEIERAAESNPWPRPIVTLDDQLRSVRRLLAGLASS